MKYLIQIIKFFNKRELEVLYAECMRRAEINNCTSINANNDSGDADYFRGKREAYKEMADAIRRRKEMHETQE